MHFLSFILKAQEEGADTGIACEYIILLAVMLFVLYMAFLTYQHFIGRWVPRAHYCKYCGRMVVAVSDCCHTYVDDRKIPNACKNCGGECRTVCNLCKRMI